MTLDDLREGFEELLTLATTADADKDATIARLSAENALLKAQIVDLFERASGRAPAPQVHVTARERTKTVLCVCGAPFQAKRGSTRKYCHECLSQMGKDRLLRAMARRRAAQNDVN